MLSKSPGGIEVIWLLYRDLEGGGRQGRSSTPEAAARLPRGTLPLSRTHSQCVQARLSVPLNRSVGLLSKLIS